MNDTNIFTKIRRALKPNKFPKADHPIRYAFTCGGIDYYEFEDFNNMPSMRAMKTTVFYEEFRMKCTLEYLGLHTQAVDNILLSSKINIFELKKLNDQLKQRLTLPLDTELLYKIGSIVFFDNKENITDYDYGYNEKKRANWKAKGGKDFFLSVPFTRLVPVLKDMEKSLRQYSQMMQNLNQIHLGSILQNLPEKKISK